MSVPLAFYWGDDDLAAGRAVEALATAIAAEAGGPPDRWTLRGDRNAAAAQLGQLRERVTSGALFGGGTLAVIANPGALTVRGEDREALLAVLPLVAPGSAVVVLESTPSGAKAPGQARLATAIGALGGEVRQFAAPKAGQLAAWIEAAARDRGVSLGPGAARELAARLGGFVTEADADRRNQTRAAILELDKLALFRPGGAVSADDVRAVVAEAVPGSVWAFSDAVGLREGARAIGLLERLAPATPEPVLLAVLHRRLRELVDVADRLAAGTPVNGLGRALGMNPYRAEKLAGQARRWTAAELQDAMDGLLALDAVVKGAPGIGGSDAQRRLAFTLWIVDRVRPGGGPAREAAAAG